MAFIKLTDVSEHQVYVNVDHIITIEHEGTGSRVDLTGDTERSNKMVNAKESPTEVMALIAQAGGR